MTVNTDKIRLGTCDVTYKGSDLGATKGGVEVEIRTSTYEVKVDQFGETPVKEIITGTMVTVKVPLAETDLARLQTMLPQSVTIAASVTLPTGYTVLGAQSEGDNTIPFTQGTNIPVVGQSVSFGTAARYLITAVDIDNDILTISPALAANVSTSQAMTFYNSTGGVEIRSGINTDLLAAAGLLKLHPTGKDLSLTEEDFTVFKCAPQPNFSFKYEQGGERIYEVTFKGYPDIAVNGRIAAFGAIS